MPKILKPKGKGSGGNAKYFARGWKQVLVSATSSVFTSTMPVSVKKGMIEASKEKRVLSTGSVFEGSLSARKKSQ